MGRYVLGRVALMVPTLFGVAVISFLILRVVPGDIVQLHYAEGAFVPKEQIEAERVRLGLAQPLWQQFGTWIWGLVRLDFGRSMWTDQPVGQEIALRLELSL